jgi:hypothetical protein
VSRYIFIERSVMLIEKKELSVNDVAVIRLVTGEELVGKVVAVSANDITITKPVILQMQMISAKEAGIGFAPFMVGADEARPLYLPARQACSPAYEGSQGHRKQLPEGHDQSGDASRLLVLPRVSYSNRIEGTRDGRSL